MGIVLIGLFGASPPPRALAQGDWETRDGGRAAKIVERLLLILERDPFNAYAYKQLEQRAAALGGMEAVAERYATRLAQRPEHIPTMLLLARFYASSERPLLSLELLNEAERKGHRRWQLYRFRSDIYADQGDVKHAAEDLEAGLLLVRDRLDKADLLRRLADLARGDGRPRDATVYYERIVALAPRDRFLRWELAQAFVEQKLWDEAIAQYEAAAKLAGGNVEERCRALLEVGDIYTELRRFQDAIAIFDRVLRVTKVGNWLNREARAQIVNAYRSAGDTEGLLARAEKALKRSRRDEWALGIKAQLLAEKGMHIESAEAYALYVKQFTKNTKVFDAYIRELIVLQRHDEVVAVYHKLIDRTRAQDERLSLVIDLVRYLEARSTPPFEAYMQLRRYEASFKDAESLGRLAQAYLELGKGGVDTTTRAEGLVEKIIALDPDRIEGYLRRLDLDLARGDQARIQETLERVISHASFDSASLEELLDHLQQVQRADLADQALDAAVKRYPEDIQIRFLWGTRRASEHDLDAMLKLWFEILLKSDLEEHIQTASLRYVELLEGQKMIGDLRGMLRARLARQPDDWRLARVVAILDAAVGDAMGALEVINSVAPFIPQGAPIEEQILSTSQARHPRQALLVLRRLMRRKPAVAWRYQLRSARILIDLDRQGESLALVEEALASAGGNAGAYLLATEVYIELEELVEAEQTVKKAIAIAPSDPRSFRVLAEVLRSRSEDEGDAQRRQQLLDEAFEHAQTATRMSRSSVEAAEMAQTFFAVGTAAGHHPSALRQTLEALAGEIPRRDISEALLKIAAAKGG